MITGQNLPYDQALRVEQRCVCNVCWGRLEHDNITNLVYNVHCAKSDCSGTSFVSKRYAEKRIEQSFFEAIEVRHAYGILFGLEKPITAKKALSDLGF